MKHEHNKGKIKDNALKALVRSNLFRYRTEKPKKGKGSYSRKIKIKTIRQSVMIALIICKFITILNN